MSFTLALTLRDDDCSSCRRLLQLILITSLRSVTRSTRCSSPLDETQMIYDVAQYDVTSRYDCVQIGRHAELTTGGVLLSFSTKCCFDAVVVDIVVV